MSLGNAVCFHTKVSARGRFLVQLDPTVFGMSECVFVCTKSKNSTGTRLRPEWGCCVTERHKNSDIVW